MLVFGILAAAVAVGSFVGVGLLIWLGSYHVGIHPRKGKKQNGNDK